jgi:hypothetical protein
MNRCFGCTSFGSPVFATLSRAAAKSAASRLRNLGVLRIHSDWLGRLAICRQCPLRVVAAGVPHCGKPLLRRIGSSDGGGAASGCGCPIEAKAKSPGEHCPLTPAGAPSRIGGDCNCKWCRRDEVSVAR